jgi:hypothetical protein
MDLYEDEAEINRLAGRDIITRRNDDITNFVNTEKNRQTGISLPLAGPRRPVTRSMNQIHQKIRQESQGIADNLERGDSPDEFEDPDEIPRDIQHEIFKRKCSCKNTNSALIRKVLKIANAKSTEKLPDQERTALVVEWYRSSVDESRLLDDAGNRILDKDAVCFAHTKYVVGKIGLKTRMLSKDQMVSLLQAIFHRKGDWVHFQSDTRTQMMFTERYQMTRTNEDLKSYRYRPSKIVVQPNWEALAKALKMQDTQKQFDKDGSITAPVFRWIFDDPELVQILDESFNMYDYHTREIDGSSNLGWCRTMFHSLIQQLVRGDLEYWLMYAILRKETNLISYPYYTKFTRPGDRTYFRHVDLNISQAAFSQRGVALIQSSV